MPGVADSQPANRIKPYGTLLRAKASTTKEETLGSKPRQSYVAAYYTQSKAKQMTQEKSRS